MKRPQKQTKPLTISTRPIHGTKLYAYKGPVETPIYQTSTYRFETSEDAIRFAKGDPSVYVYTRYHKPTVNEAEERLALMMGTERALLFSSGMAAISEYSPAFLGGTIHLAGLGILSTSITVTIFYVCFLEIWRRRYNKPFTTWYYILIAAAIVRYIVMTPPQKHWESHIAPADWSIFRNLFLTIQGLGVAILMWVDARKAQDHLFLWFSVLIVVSYFCMWTVIPFYEMIPLIGMMMIPKTVAIWP